MGPALFVEFTRRKYKADILCDGAGSGSHNQAAVAEQNLKACSVMNGQLNDMPGSYLRGLAELPAQRSVKFSKSWLDAQPMPW